MSTPDPFVACSKRFANEGLRLDAESLGEEDSSVCPRCAFNEGRKLNRNRFATLAQRFFVWGSVHKRDYGAAPEIQFNEHRKTDSDLRGALGTDTLVFEDALGIGFFLYGPRLWMLGNIEPLEELQSKETRSAVIDRILGEYGSRTLTAHVKFYRIRKNPSGPSQDSQYDSPPSGLPNGRLDTPELPALYGSPDLQTCLHECRVTAEDDLFVATLRPLRDLKFLDVAALLDEPQGVTEFESLDLAVNMLFLAGNHSYPITRELSLAVKSAGFDGLIYPSYFNMLRSGGKPFENAFGLSLRKLPQYKKFEEVKVSVNSAIFGRPIQDKLVDVCCIN